MSNQEKRPVPGQPEPAKILVYLSDAQQMMDEKRRVAAVHALHVLLCRWRAEARTAEAAAIAAYAAVPLPPGTPPQVVRKGRFSWTVELLAAEPARRAQAETAAIEAAIQQRREHWIGLGAPRHFDRMLRIFFERAGRAIFASPDPPAAMRIFWKGKPWQVRKETEKAERDFALAVEVQTRIYGGANGVAARKAVADAACLSAEDIRKIYYRWRDEAQLMLAWPALVANWRTGEEWDWSAFIEAPLSEPE
jgi:hypothetical protein